MALFMLYALLVGLLVTIAARLIEPAAAEQLGLPRRSVWSAALVASIALPIYATLSSRDAPSPRAVEAPALPAAAPTSDQSSAATPSGAGSSGGSPPAFVKLDLPGFVASFGRVADFPLRILWLGSSAGAVLVYFLAWVALLRAARRWRWTEIDGTRVLLSRRTGPAVVGFAKPRIVVPRWLLDAPETVRAMVLRHEQEHVAARDQLLLLAGLAVCAIAPWNAFLWVQLRRLRLAIEIDCDGRVVGRGSDRVTYSRALLAVRERRSIAPLTGIALTEPVSQLERRIRLMLEGAPRARKPLTALTVAGGLGAFLAACALQPPGTADNPPPAGGAAADEARTAEPPERRPESAAGADIGIASAELRRQPVTGLLLGGTRVAILVDVSASMLDRVPVSAERRAAMTAAEQRQTQKWRQLVAAVEWVTTQIPDESQFQVIAFNDGARSLVTGADWEWIAADDERAIERAVRALREEALPRGERNLESAFAALGNLAPPPDNVYLLVDGLPTTSDTVQASSGSQEHLDAALRHQPPAAPVNVILLPMENEPLAAPAYWTVALETRGSLVAPAEDWP